MGKRKRMGTLSGIPGIVGDLRDNREKEVVEMESVDRYELGYRGYEMTHISTL